MSKLLNASVAWRVEYVDANGEWRLWLQCETRDSAVVHLEKCRRTLRANELETSVRIRLDGAPDA